MPHPVLLASLVMTYVGVAYGHQLTDGLFGLRSRRTHAVDDDLSLLVRDHLLRLVSLSWRQVDRTRQVAHLVVPLRRRLHEVEVLPRSILAFSSSLEISLTTARSLFPASHPNVLAPDSR